ncbi:MAG: hypothetical protein Q8Q33_02840 [Chlamydiota bacterium]|nr:hypothetical protein [Chlamydiota bacterium]
MLLRKAWIPVILFLFIFIVHWRSPVITSTDSVWSIYTAESITQEYNTNLDEYEDTIELHMHYAIERVNQHYYNTFPLGTSLICVPFVMAIDGALAIPIIQEHYQDKTGIHKIIRATDIYGLVERMIASIIVAMSAILIYLIALSSLEQRSALFLSLLFAFCTPAWSTASRALWQHGPSMLMLTLTLYIIVKAQKRPWTIVLAGIPLSFSYIIRPTNAISIIILSIYIIIKYRSFFLYYAGFGLMIMIPFFLYNLNIYANLLSPYYMPGRIGLNPDFYEALAANLFSPARGLLIYSPVLLLTVFGFKLKSKQNDLLYKLIAVIIIAHWISISSFPHWWAGHSYGPRFFTDMIPYFMFLLIPSFKWLSHARGPMKFICMVLCIMSISISGFIHARGALSFEANEWNDKPQNVDAFPDRIWEWKDPQFMRGFSI